MFTDTTLQPNDERRAETAPVIRVDGYRFVALDSHGAGGEDRAVELRILVQDDHCAAQFRKVWTKMYAALKGYHEAIDSSSAPGWVNWKPTDWYEGKKVTDRQRFAAWAGETLVGFLNVRPDYPSYWSPGQRLLYIEHIATAPGNILTDVWGLRLKSIGTSLMAFAILQSVQQGFEGRLGFHAADDAAAAYYDRLAQRHPFLRVPLRGVAGTPEDRGAAQHAYYESEPHAALAFLDGYRHG